MNVDLVSASSSFTLRRSCGKGDVRRLNSNDLEQLEQRKERRYDVKAVDRNAANLLGERLIACHEDIRCRRRRRVPEVIPVTTPRAPRLGAITECRREHQRHCGADGKANRAK